MPSHCELVAGYGFLRQQRPDLALVDIFKRQEPLGLALLTSLIHDAELRNLR